MSPEVPSVRIPAELPDGVSQATIGVRGGLLRSGFEETAEAMYLTSGYVYQSAADAEKALTQGLAIEDQSFLGHLNLARIYWERARAIKDLAQAKPSLEKSYDEVKRALTLNPNLGGAHLLKGNLLLRVGRATDSLVEFDEYLKLEPNGPFAAETRSLVEKIKKATSQSGRG